LTAELFRSITHKFSLYQGLIKFGISLVEFDLEAQKEHIAKIMVNHAATLRHISFAKNKVTGTFLKFVCEAVAEYNVVEVFDLRHLKEVKNIDWVEYLKSIALLSKNSNRIV
jgi:hypothetical protein